MAPSVGETHSMLLMEGHRWKERGTDVVIGFVETYGRPMTIAATGDLEVVPRREIMYKGVRLEEMDTEAVICHHPAGALVNELVRTNAVGSKYEKRWQDVMELLDHGITVISTVNIQYLESLAGIVEGITGVPVRERLPDRILDEADEIELVDMSLHALRQHIEHGNVYPRDRAEQALRQFFREGNLTALRELALRKMATAVVRPRETDVAKALARRMWAAWWLGTLARSPGFWSSGQGRWSTN